MELALSHCFQHLCKVLSETESHIPSAVITLPQQAGKSGTTENANKNIKKRNKNVASMKGKKKKTVNEYATCK